MNGLSPILLVQSERHKPGYSPNIGEIDGIWGLDRDAAITHGYGEIENVVWVRVLRMAMTSPMV